jgi:hypothetical protein
MCEDMYEYENVPRELMEKIDCLIKDELNGRTGRTIEGLKRAEETNEMLKKTICNLRNEINMLNIKHKKELKKAFENGERKFCLGFIPGDEVYYVDSKRRYTKCDKCNDGKVEIEIFSKLTKVECPCCEGKGRIGKSEYFPTKDIVSSLKFWVVMEDQYIANFPLAERNVEIYLKKRDYSMEPKELFKTIEECQNACNEKVEVETYV